MAEDYGINEKDTDSVIRYLKTVDPENATPEMAIDILEELHARVHMLSHENPQLLSEIYRELRAKRKRKRSK